MIVTPKPPEYTAIQYNGSNIDELSDNGFRIRTEIDSKKTYVSVRTGATTYKPLFPTHWVVRMHAPNHLGFDNLLTSQDLERVYVMTDEMFHRVFVAK